jgi:hypothetical protein
MGKEGKISEKEIAGLTGLVKSEQAKKALANFLAGLSRVENINISDRGDCYEIVVSHLPQEIAPGEVLTGGAEQYFLDKTTAAIDMGWHEHPMSESDLLVNADEAPGAELSVQRFQFVDVPRAIEFLRAGGNTEVMVSHAGEYQITRAKAGTVICQPKVQKEFDEINAVISELQDTGNIVSWSCE